MSLPNRLAAYDDCIAAYNEASATGARFQFETHGEAHMFMMRMHNARALQRSEMQRIYKLDDVRWGKTEWDRLTVRQPREDETGKYWIYVEVTGSNILAVERLEPRTTLAALTAPTLQLTGPTDELT